LKKTQNKEQVDLFRMTHTKFMSNVLDDCDDFDELRKDIDNRYDSIIAALRGDIITTGRSGISNDDWLKRVEREKVLVSESNAKVEDDNVSYFRILFKF
jgi:hypothetical protein